MISGELTHTVHVTSYLRKSANFHESLCENSQIVCDEPMESSFGICRIVFQDPQNHLSGSRESFFGSPQNCLSSARGSSYESPLNDLWKTTSYRVREIVFGSPQISFKHSTATLQRNIPQVHMEILQIPSNVSADTQQCFHV